MVNFTQKDFFLKSPRWIQKLAAHCSPGCYVLGLILRIRPLQFRRFLHKSQWFPLERLQRYQLERLQYLLRYAYHNVPYYQDIFRKNNLTPDDFNSLKDLTKLPILTRQDVADNLDRLLSRKADKKYLELTSTSGSTGIPVRFYRDKRRRHIQFAFLYRALSAVGIKGYWRNIWIWERPFIERNIQERYIYEPYLNRLTLPLRHSQESIWQERIELIRQFEPAYIVANPYLLYDFTSYLKENGIDDVHFKFFMSSFENLYAHQRKRIEEQFHCKAYSRYTCHESAVSGFECIQQKGFHIDMENSIVEIVDTDGAVVPQGRSGRLITTPLHNVAMPFIRYDIGDIASLSDASCPCGRGLQLLRALEGRSAQVIRYKDKSVYHNTLTSALLRCKHIKAAQFIQETEETLAVNIVRKDGFSGDDAQDLIGHLHRIIDERLHITIHFVDSIDYTPGGKFPFIIPVKRR